MKIHVNLTLFAALFLSLPAFGREAAFHKDTVHNYVFNYMEPAKSNISAKTPRRFKGDSMFRAPILAFRSNILAPLTNIGIEIPVSGRVSLEADFYSPWALRKWLPANKDSFQFIEGTVGCRLWIGNLHNAKKGESNYRLRGHSIGIIASGGMYDIERNWKGQQGEFAFLGVDYLYGLPLGKGRAHFEFNLGIGYGINRFNNYNVRYEGGKLINNGGKRIRHLPVPIRIGGSIAIPVFNKNSNTGKREGLCNE